MGCRTARKERPRTGYGAEAMREALTAWMALRSTSPALTALAARHEREHERAAAPVLPKGADLSRWSAEDSQAVAATLSGRPRKPLGWKTPAEAFKNS